MKKLLAICLILYTCFFILKTGSAHADIQHNTDVTAFIPPKTSDYQFDFIAQDGQTTVTNGSIMTYQITYGVNQSANFAATNTTIVVNWSNDLSPNGEI